MNMNYIFEAIKEIDSKAEISIINDKIVWLNRETPPVNDEYIIQRAKVLEQNSAYKNFRREKYPKLEEQLDMLWHSIDNGSLDKESDFYKSIKAVKEEFPKP